MAEGPGGDDPTTVTDDPTTVTDDADYLRQVMAEIDDEVRRQRSSGDLPARVERELDELFLQHSPVAGHGGGLDDALRMVDAAAFIDPVVPIASNRSGGAVVKKGLRTLNLWYIGYVTHQVSRFATAVSRSLHLVDERLQSLERQLAAQRLPPAEVLDVGWAHRPDAWWVPVAVDAVGSAPGRVLHAASGDGWLVRALGDRGVDAYGVDPRPGIVSRAELEGTDLREEDVLEHLRAVAPASLGGVVLSGVVDGMAAGERQQLLSLLADRVAPEGVLVLHSLAPSAWSSEKAPVAADLAPGRPLRPASWVSVLGAAGFDATVPGPATSDDYVVVAVQRPVPRPR